MHYLKALIIFFLLFLPLSFSQAEQHQPKIAYIVSDLRIPFWDIMKRGIENRATQLGYSLSVYSAENSAKEELKAVFESINDQVDGLVISPTNSSAAVTILKLANNAKIPVVISDIGTDSGDYVSYIASDNYNGSYQLGKILVDTFQDNNWDTGSVGVIAIPQKRANGQARTSGFLKALTEAGITGGQMRQQVDFSYQETYDFARELIRENRYMKAIWLQGSDRYQAALDAITDSNKEGEIVLICFDAEPEFIDMIREGKLVGAGMQQPFLMGETAVEELDAFIRNPVELQSKNILLPVLAISSKNLEENLPVIKRNVLGIPVN